MNIDLLEHGERYDFYATMQSLGYDVMIVSARSRTALGYQEVVKGEDEIRSESIPGTVLGAKFAADSQIFQHS